MSIVSYQDVKAHLNLSDDESAVELQTFITAADSIIEGQIGAVTPTTYTEQYNGGTSIILLNHTPVMSITSITEYLGNSSFPLTAQPVGFATSPWGYTLDDPLSGRITRRGMNSDPVLFAGQQEAVTVTYVAGRSSVPASVKLAELVVIADLWSTQRGTAALPPLGGVPGPMPTSGGGMLSPLAQQLLEGSGLMKVPGIA